MLGHSLNGVTFTPFDPRFLPAHHRTVDVLAHFLCSPAASGMPIPTVVSESTTSSTSCLRQTGDLMLSTTLLPCCCSATPQRCGSVHSLSLPPRVTSGCVVTSPDLVRLTEDPLSARYLRPLESNPTLTHDPSSLPSKLLPQVSIKVTQPCRRWEVHVLPLCGDVWMTAICSGGCIGLVVQPGFCCECCWRGRPDRLA